MNKRLPKWNVGAERIETRSAEPRQLANEAVGYAGASTAAQSGKLQGVRSAECPSPIDRPHIYYPVVIVPSALTAIFTGASGVGAGPLTTAAFLAGSKTAL